MIRILNANIQDTTCSELLQSLKKGVLITTNLDHLVKLQHDNDFYSCYCHAEWVVCDSRILQFCSRLLPLSFPEAIPGSNFFPAFCEFHKNNPDCRIFLLGAKNGIAAKAMKRINARIGREIVVGAISPSLKFENKDEENAAIIKTINASGANVVVVGVGAPKQEKWIMTHKNKMPSVDIWMALGATIDFEAGNIARAPKWVQHAGMEWLYRFFHEPRRLFKRYFVDDMAFFYYFTLQLCGKYKNPFAKIN